MNYMLILNNPLSPFGSRRWQLLFSYAGSRDYVISYARAVIAKDPLLKAYMGDIDLFKCDDMDEKIAKDWMCVFNVRQNTSVIGGE